MEISRKGFWFVTFNIRAGLCRCKHMYYESQIRRGYNWMQISPQILGVVLSHSSLSKNSTLKNPHLHTHSMITLLLLNVPNSKCRRCLPATNLAVWVVQVTSQMSWENRLLNAAHRQTTLPTDTVCIHYPGVGNCSLPVKYNRAHALRMHKRHHMPPEHRWGLERSK